jgi:exopolysaccharide production protein ExoQ
MPIIALTLSLLFSAVLILRDCTRRREVSHTVWIPTILVMILASRPVSLWLSGRGATLGIEDANSLQSSTADQMFYLFVLGSSFLTASIRKVNWGKLFSSNVAIMLFYAYFAISISWSSDPTGSTKRLVKDFGLLFMAAVIYSEKYPLQAMRAVYLRCAYLLLPLSVVFIKYYPNFGRAYGSGGEMMYTGVTPQKNSLGEMVLLFILFITWEFLERGGIKSMRKWRRAPWDLIVMLLIGIWLLRLCQSKRALVCVLVGVFLVVRSRWFLSKVVSRTALIGALFLPVLVFFSQQFTEVINPLLHALGRDSTFTGRSDIWRHINLETVNPLIGAGFWNFWGGPGGLRLNEAMNEVIPNAHNGYMDMYLDGGLIGLVFLFIMLSACGGRIIKYLKPGGDSSHFHRMRFAILIVAIIYNLAESTFARVGAIWFTTLLMMADYSALMGMTQKARTALRSRRKPMKTHASPTVVTR